MIPSGAITFAFIFFALVCLIITICFRSDFYLKFKKFYIATAAIYLSGTVMVFFVCRNIGEVPAFVAIISEVFMSVIFRISVFTLTYVGKKADEIKRESEASD